MPKNATRDVNIVHQCPFLILHLFLSSIQHKGHKAFQTVLFDCRKDLESILVKAPQVVKFLTKIDVFVCIKIELTTNIDTIINYICRLYKRANARLHQHIQKHD